MLDPVRERFVQEYHATGNASEAFRRAKPAACKWKENSVNSRASQMLAEAKIQQRLAELRAEAAEAHGITRDTIAAMLKEDRQKAHGANQIGAAVSATMGMAKLYGHIVDKSEVTRKRDLADISDAELAALARTGGKGAAAPPARKARADRIH